MIDATQPLTIIQDATCAEWREIMRRFHRPALVTRDCVECGDPFSFEAHAQRHRKYCSDACRIRAGHRAERYRRLAIATRRLRDGRAA